MMHRLVLTTCLLFASTAGPCAAAATAAIGTSGAAASGDRPFPRMTLPLESQTKKGKPGGAINLVIVAIHEHMDDAMEKAGWARADATTLHTAVKIAKDVVKHQAYPGAPVSPAYMFGRKQDEAWEKEVNDPRVRDHLRLWDSGKKDAKGRHIYAVGASKDVAVIRKAHSLLPTHQIDPDIDKESSTILADLNKTGSVASTYTLKGLGPSKKKDMVGNPYFTKGLVQVIVLK
jgi:hypothetical protein